MMVHCRIVSVRPYPRDSSYVTQMLELSEVEENDVVPDGDYKAFKMALPFFIYELRPRCAITGSRYNVFSVTREKRRLRTGETEVVISSIDGIYRCDPWATRPGH